VKAVAYLHRKRFLHRDLKCANCFLTANNEMKVGDFGHASRMYAESKEQAQLPERHKPKNNMAPEVFFGMPHVAASDVYQIGLIAYEMAALCRPIYSERKCCEMCGEVFPARIPAHYSDDLNALTMHMMEEDLIMRPTAEWLEHHVFFAGNSHLWEQEYGECDKMNGELEKLRAEGAAEKMRYLKRQLEFLRG